MKVIPRPRNVFAVFYAVTGVALGALLTGFGQCMFDIDEVSKCADHAHYAFDTLKSVGDHVVDWLMAFSSEVMDRHG